MVTNSDIYTYYLRYLHVHSFVWLTKYPKGLSLSTTSTKTLVIKQKPDEKKNLPIAGGESTGGRQTRNGVAVCSQKRALCVTGAVLGCLLGIALIIAFAGTGSGKFTRTNNEFCTYFLSVLLVNFKFFYIKNALCYGNVSN